MELESVQSKFIRLIDGIALMAYKERLNSLQLTTHIEHKARGDLLAG